MTTTLAEAQNSLVGRALTIETPSITNPNYFLSHYFLMLVLSIIAINRTLALVRPRRPRRIATALRVILRLWNTSNLLTTTIKLATLVYYNNFVSSPDNSYGPGTKIVEKTLWQFYKSLCFTTFLDVFTDCLTNGRPRQAETPNLFELSMTLHYASHTPSFPQLLVVIFLECCKLLSMNMLLSITDKANRIRLIPTSIFGIAQLLHFGWCFVSGKPYPLLPFLSRIPEAIVILVISNVLLLQWVMNVVNEGRARGVLDTMRWGWNEDFSTVLYRCGQLCMETSAHVGMNNELEPLVAQEMPRRQSIRKSPFTKLVEIKEEGENKLKLQQQSALRWWTLLFRAGMGKVKIWLGKWFPRLSPPPIPIKVDEEDDDLDYAPESDSESTDSDSSESQESEMESDVEEDASLEDEPEDLYKEVFDLLQDVEEEPSNDSLFARLMERNASQPVDRRLCVVCATEARNIVLRPCMCLVLCDDCRGELALRGNKICPTCRRSVSGYSKIYEP